MSRTVVRAMTGALALTAAAAVIPLGSPAAAVADSIVIGGQPAHVKDSPWVVALSSRDRFGGTRAGQFCGAVVVEPKKAITAAHCLTREALGVDVGQVRDLRIISGRDELNGTDGKEIAVSGTWVNPGFDATTNSGDVAVLTLAEALPEQSVIPMAPAGDSAYDSGTAAVVYGWGDTTGNGDYATSLRSAKVTVLPDSSCEQAYPGGGNGTYEASAMLCAGEPEGGYDACQGDSGGPLVAQGRLVGLVSWGSGCGRAGSPGVYTRISAAIEWMKDAD
ncbi:MULTISPECIES: trypsin-like serine protease [unclassified Streptomyces]|uniref:S1 family peptidase n=1 Tax=unclassified Streptomyces TaxID=2593676 RepID=UPI002258C772|nr:MULTISPECIES: serine protease [unclassified Streptomyces]MCX5143405.1 serine protease [Streptomyces sp. NBC_00338]WRZ67823.1 serine protease [Streptomyces sp. NBC_01257]WSU61810.1 serine protease [Streptomyces sp. NBC_01104]